MPPHGSTLDVEAVLKTDRWIRQLSRYLVATDCDADDVGQETWLAVLKEQSPGSERSRSWISRVASNFAMRRHRDSTRRRRREQAAALASRESSLPEEALERAELRQEVLQAVLALREPYRTTIVLRFFEDMSLRQVAASQRVPLNTVKTRVCRALEVLRVRLDRRYGTRAAWALLLLPMVPCGLLKGGAVAACGVAWSAMKQGVIAAMSTKTIASAVCVSVAIIAGLGIASFRFLRETEDLAARASPPAKERPATAVTGGRAPSGARAALETAGELAHGPAAQAAEAELLVGVEKPVTPDDELDPRAEPAPGAPASEAVLAARTAFAALKKSFGDGGREGWRSVGWNLGALEKAFLSSEEGFAEFLAMLDGETDASFLEAVMHHLPLAGTESRGQVLENARLHEEIWARYEQDADPERRRAFLRFFAYEGKLSASHMDAILEVAAKEPDAKVRQLGIDSIASNRELIGETWEILARVAESDPSIECRETAISGLAYAGTDRASALVTAAFTSSDERLRAAAWTSSAGDEPPAQVTGGDPVVYLAKEFRIATSRGYKRALTHRLMERAPQVLEEEIERALPWEKDWGVRRDYNDALKKIAGDREARSK